MGSFILTKESRNPVFAFIEAKVMHEKKVGRHDIVACFGVSEPTAGRYLRKYAKLTGSIKYDKSLKYYGPTPTFDSLYLEEFDSTAAGFLKLMSLVCVHPDTQTFYSEP